MIIAKIQTPPDEASAAAQLKAFQEKGPEVQREAEAARKLIKAIIADPSTPSDDVALTRIDDRIDTAVNDLRRRLDEEIGQLLRQLEGQNFTEVLNGLGRVDSLYDEFNQKMDLIRADMLGQVHESASTVIRNQQRAIWISAVVTAIAAALGFMFAMLVGSGITRPVYQLLEGTREVEAGRFDKVWIPVTTRDEIGQLSIAFNGMIERLRNNERIREIFGKYIDPRVAKSARFTRPTGNGSHARPAPGDDGNVLRHEGVHDAQRRGDAAGAPQSHEPLPVNDVRADPQPPRYYR